MYKKGKIIFFCMIFVAATVFSQDQPVKRGELVWLKTVKQSPLSLIRLVKTDPRAISFNPVIAPDFYVKQLGFFCTQEIKFEKATKIPFRFRLGSIEDCDRMEGKRQFSIKN